MMSLSKLARLVGQNAVRNRRHFALSAFGIVVGIAAFVFFLGLSLGVRKVVLGDMFPIDRVEVVAPKTALSGVLGATIKRKLDDSIVERIREHGGVKDVVPRMALGFPTLGKAWFEDTELKFELVGDGIDPSYMAGEDFAEKFKDWDEGVDASQLKSCIPRRKGPVPRPVLLRPGRTKVPSPGAHGRVSSAGRDLQHPVAPSPMACRSSGPWKSSSSSAVGLSKMRMYVHLGSTMVAAANKTLKARPREVEGVLLGISDKAIPIGVTVPMGYIKRWNLQYLGEEAASTYSSIVVTLEDKSEIGRFGAWVEKELDLRLQDSQGEKFALVIMIVTSLFLLISLVIVSISAINIAHSFFMQVSERRRELGLLRAIGATRGDIRGLILGEAALIGIFSGTLGVGCALIAGKVVDWIASAYLPDFPFKPETFFDFTWWIVVGGLAFSVVFCVFGGMLPAGKAARIEPARALAQQ